MRSPELVGRYAVYERIASGGMATVHVGRLLGPVGFSRTVAIKRMHAQFTGDPEFVSMFLDEARLAARIRHPNVVSTLDVVATDGELFLVLEYVHGETLAVLGRRATALGGSIPVPVAAAIISGVLHGLHAAHEAKNEKGEPLEIVHRDVSPDNVMVGIDGVARVLDFGVAKAAGRLQKTAAGTIKGKVAYMPPEQILHNTVTRRCDIYAASVVLWEALTGQRLFRAETHGATLHRVLHLAVDPPSAQRPEVPAELDAVVLRGLSRDPEERFATARAMATALEAAVSVAIAPAIGAWVDAIAAEAISEQSERLARIESESGTTRDDPPPVDLDNVPTRAEGVTPSQVSAQRPAELVPASTVRRNGLVGLALALVAGGVIGLTRASSPVEAAPGIASAPAPSTLPLPSASAAVAARETAPPPSVATSPDPLPSARDEARTRGGDPTRRAPATKQPSTTKPASKPEVTPPPAPAYNPLEHM